MKVPDSSSHVTLFLTVYRSSKDWRAGWDRWLLGEERVKTKDFLVRNT